MNKKSFLTIAASLSLFSLLGAFAACSPVSEQGATITLTTGDGGTLAAATIENVPQGTALNDFLADYEPVPKQGLTFAGWYNGSALIEDDDTMPETALTLTAKYWANYTVDIYTMDRTTYEYGQTPQKETGKAIYGEALDLGNSSLVPAHYKADTLHQNSRTRTNALGVNEQFTLWLALDSNVVIYYPNAPRGVAASGATERTLVYSGDAFTVAENGFTLPRGYRFAGWTTNSASGEVEYMPGESVTPDGNLYLYAIWERGLSDAFSGGDFLFISTTEPNTVWLDRVGMEEKKGTYDPATGQFTFMENGKIVLDGKLLENSFYYFLDAFENTYEGIDGAAERMVLSPNGKAAYYPTGMSGEAIEGNYAFDVDTGYFSFRSATETFLFNLLESTSGGAPVFRRQDMQEEGYYYDAGRDIVLYLDGLGGLEYHFNRENYEWMLAGEPVLTVYGYYEWNEQIGMYLAYTRDFAGILEEFTFQTPDTGATLPSVHEDFEKFDLKGAVRLDDRFRGEYTDKWESAASALYLDGYGAGTYGEAEGTYEIITWVYVYEDEEGDVFDDYWLVKFTETASGDIYYFRLDVAYGDYELDHTIRSAEKIQDIPTGRMDFDNIFVLNSNFKGFLYVFENGAAEVWTEYAQMSTGDIAYVLYKELISSVEKNGDFYTFKETKNEYTGVSDNNGFEFTISGGKVEQRYDEVHQTYNVIPDHLVLDVTTGIATYDGEPIAYTCTLGTINFFLFYFEDGYRYFISEADYTDFREVYVRDMYDISYPEGREGNFYDARLLIPADGDDTAYLGLILDSGLARYVAKGTVGGGTNGVYSFAIDASTIMQGFGEADLAEYRAFNFKREQLTIAGTDYIGYFVQEGTGETYQGENISFVSDGYGTYTYTDKAGVNHSGEILLTIGEEANFRLVVFGEATASDALYKLVLRSDKTVKDVTDTDAGYAYELDENNLTSLYDYLVMDGEGNAYFYTYNVLDGTTQASYATYTKTQKWAEDHREFSFQERQETFELFIASYEVEDRILPLYQKKVLHRIGAFEVTGGGSISSEGYPNMAATYVDADGRTYEGNMYIGNVNTGTYSHSFNNNANGQYVRFWVVVNNAYTSTEFLFYKGTSNSEVTLLPLPVGDYAQEESGVVDTAKLLHLDGMGKATLRSGYSAQEEGTYEAAPEQDGYLYKGPSGPFIFRVSSVSLEDDLTCFVFSKLTEDDRAVYMNRDDWSVLDIDGYGTATYTAPFGAVYTGNCYILADGLGYFGAGSEEFLFRFDKATKIFERVDNSSYISAWYASDFSAIAFGQCIAVIGGEEYYYLGQGAKITLWPLSGGDSIEIDAPASEQQSYTYLGKSYSRWNGEELTFTDTEFDAKFGEVTLAFTPDGAIFTVSAKFMGDEGYALIAAYEDGAPVFTLTWRGASSDSLLEEYLVTLNYTSKTFTIVPLGEDGEYAVNGHNGVAMTVCGKRVGDHLLGNLLSFTFDFVKDAEGASLSFNGEYSAIEEDPTNITSYGTLRKLVVEGTDEKDYTVAFYLYNNVCYLDAVTLDTVCNVEGVGEVTFRQHWYKENSAHAQYDLIDLSMPENGVTTNIYNGAKDGLAILVTQTMDSVTGAYKYFSYVLDVTFGEDGLVESAQLDAHDYRYGAASSSDGRYDVRFLYHLDGEGNIALDYILSFSVSQHVAASEFVQVTGGTNEVSIEAEGRTYTIEVEVNYGSGDNVFKLKVEVQA